MEIALFGIRWWVWILCLGLLLSGLFPAEVFALVALSAAPLLFNAAAAAVIVIAIRGVRLHG